jgi:hypothetical protein
MSDIKVSPSGSEFHDEGRDHEEGRKHHEEGRKHERCDNSLDAQYRLLTKHKPLFWNRINLMIPPFTTVLVNTGIRQSERECLNPFIGLIPIETGETDIPPFNDETGVQAISTLPVLPGSLPASRVMVIPMPPIAPWVQVAIPTEPFWDPQTKSVIITLANTGPTLVPLNVLVWNPSYFNGPGEAVPYANMPSVLGDVNNPTP